MAALERASASLDFAMLKAVSGATDGNLGAHIRTLQEAGYVEVTKEAVGGRTRTWVELTSAGRRAFRSLWSGASPLPSTEILAAARRVS